MDPTLCCEAPQWEVNRSGASGGGAAGSPGHPRPAPAAPAAKRRPRPAERRRPAGAASGEGRAAGSPSPPPPLPREPPVSGRSTPALGGGRGGERRPRKGSGSGSASGTSRPGLSSQLPGKGCHRSWVGGGQQGWDGTAPSRSLTFGPGGVQGLGLSSPSLPFPKFTDSVGHLHPQSQSQSFMASRNPEFHAPSWYHLNIYLPKINNNSIKYLVF